MANDAHDFPTWPTWSIIGMESPGASLMGRPGDIPATHSCNPATFLQPQMPQALPWRRYTPVRGGLLAQWELIYQDHSIKDVEIVLKDGATIMADSLVLKVASPVFRAMLTHELQEKREMKFVIDDYSSVEFRFFLRLLYTGRMDPAEWREDDPAGGCVQQEDGSVGEDPQTNSPSVSHSPSVSQPPATAHPVLPFECHQRDGSLGVPDSAWADPGTAWMHTACMARLPPVELLLAAAALSKRYQVDWLLHVLVDVVTSRITEASFERILLAAMMHDIAPVRLGALAFAQRSQEVRWQYDAGKFSPEIIYELQAAFPVPPSGFCEANTISI